MVAPSKSAGHPGLDFSTDTEKLACLAAWAELREKSTRTEVLYQRHFHSLGLRP